MILLPGIYHVIVAQLCLTLCDCMNYSLPVSFVHVILQQEYWSGFPFPSPGDLSDPGIEPGSPTLQADSLPFKPSRSPCTLRKPKLKNMHVYNHHCSTITIATTWKLLKYPLRDEWIKKMWYTYTIKYYCTIKRKETGSFVVMWINLEPVIWSELCQKEKNKSRKMVHMSLFAG